MDKNIIITGAHIRLRPMTETDLPLKVQWYNDPDIRKTLIIDETFELEKTVQWFRAVKDSPTRLDWAIENEQGKTIGLIGLVEIEEKHQTAEIYIVIGDKEYWAKGVMLQAESLLIDWAFNRLGLKKIWAQSRTENIASMITMKKLGFHTEGTLRKHRQIAGRQIDIYQVGLLKEEFKTVS